MDYSICNFFNARIYFLLKSLNNYYNDINIDNIYYDKDINNII